MKEVKTQWCVAWINAQFRKAHCNGIEVNLFWDRAEKSGLWVRGTYGTQMSEALSELTTVETVNGPDGQFLYNAFRLKNEISFTWEISGADLPVRRIEASSFDKALKAARLHNPAYCRGRVIGEVRA